MPNYSPSPPPGRHRREDQEPPVPSSSEVWATLGVTALSVLLLAWFIFPALFSLFT